MHYVNIEEIPRLTKGMGDSSGVYIHYSTKAQRKIVGMISLHVQTNLPPLSRSYQDVTCTLKEKKVTKILINKCSSKYECIKNNAKSRYCIWECGWDIFWKISE